MQIPLSGIWIGYRFQVPRIVANQIYWWQKFTQQCKSHNVKKGIYMRPATAEHLSGLGSQSFECVFVCVGFDSFTWLPSDSHQIAPPRQRSAHWMDMPATWKCEGHIGCDLPMASPVQKPGDTTSIH